MKFKISFNTLDLLYQTSLSLLDFAVGTGPNAGVVRAGGR